MSDHVICSQETFYQKRKLQYLITTKVTNINLIQVQVIRKMFEQMETK